MPRECIALRLRACDHERAATAFLVVHAADDGDGRAVFQREINRACQQASDAGSFAGVLDPDSGSRILIFGHHLSNKLLGLKSGQQVVDGGVFREPMRPIELAADEAAQSPRSSNKCSEPCGNLDFIALMRVEKGEAGRIGFHQLAKIISRWNGELRQWTRRSPECDGLGVIPSPEKEGELRSELFVHHPHGTEYPHLCEMWDTLCLLEN